MHPEFELSPELIHLNHAAVGPWPRRTRLAVEDFARDNATWGSLHYPRWLQTETRLREQFARLIGAPAIDDIALLKNTSEALSVVAHGLAWKAGDEVVISDQEFPSNRIVWESLGRYGVKVVAVDLHAGTTPEQALQSACTTRTRLLSISSVQYASGLRLDLARLGRFCRQQKILFCVDAIQSLGALQMDVEAIHADFVMADGHKWMLGPEGVALFYSRSSAREQLQLHQYGWHMVEHYQDFDRKDWEIAHTARRFECGSPNMLGIHALQASLGLLLEIGLANIEQQVLDKTRQLMQLIVESENLDCLTDSRPGRYAGIVTLRHREVPGEHLYRYLMERQVLCALRGGGVRFSPHFYTPLSHLERAVDLANDSPFPE
jgi:selenocysteine lyase/cysteine desulfurase